MLLPLCCTDARFSFLFRRTSEGGILSDPFGGHLTDLCACVFRRSPQNRVFRAFFSMLHISPQGCGGSMRSQRKVDLDHADCLFAEAALTTVHPKLLHVEYASRIPPPLDYVQHYQPDLLRTSLLDRDSPLLTGELDVGPRRGDRPHEAAGSAGSGSGGRELTGCSLTAFLRLATGYSLVAAGIEDILLVRRDLQPKLRVGPPPDAFDAWARGAFCQPLHGCHSGHALWGFDFRALAEPEFSFEQRAGMLKKLLEDFGAHGGPDLGRFSVEGRWPETWRGPKGAWPVPASQRLALGEPARFGPSLAQQGQARSGPENSTLPRAGGADVRPVARQPPSDFAFRASTV